MSVYVCACVGRERSQKDYRIACWGGSLRRPYHQADRPEDCILFSVFFPPLFFNFYFHTNFQTIFSPTISNPCPTQCTRVLTHTIDRITKQNVETIVLDLFAFSCLTFIFHTQTLTIIPRQLRVPTQRNARVRAHTQPLSARCTRIMCLCLHLHCIFTVVFEFPTVLFSGLQQEPNLLIRLFSLSSQVYKCFLLVYIYNFTYVQHTHAHVHVHTHVHIHTHAHARANMPRYAQKLRIEEQVRLSLIHSL